MRQMRGKCAYRALFGILVPTYASAVRRPDQTSVMHNEALAPQTADSCLDLGHLNRQTGDDLPLQHELLTLFDARSREVLDQIRTASTVAARDGTPLRNLAHQLRGSALAIGAFGVATAAEAVETAATSGAGAAAIQAAVSDLGTAHTQALAAIEGHLRQLAAQALN
jgi:HPt (histidine-containing phosphotransfer) domain-containing protein